MMNYNIVRIDAQAEVIVASATDMDTACAVQELLGKMNPFKDFCIVRPNILIESIEYGRNDVA